MAILDGAGKGVDLGKILDAAKGFDSDVKLSSILTQNGINSVTESGNLAAMQTKQGQLKKPFVAVIKVDGSPAGEFPNGGGLHAVVVDGFTKRYGQDVVAIRNPWGRQYFQLRAAFEKHFQNRWIRPR